MLKKLLIITKGKITTPEPNGAVTHSWPPLGVALQVYPKIVLSLKVTPS